MHTKMTHTYVPSSQTQFAGVTTQNVGNIAREAFGNKIT